MSKSFTRRCAPNRTFIEGVSYRVVYEDEYGTVRESTVRIRAGVDLHSFVRERFGAVGEYLVEQIGFETLE